MKSVTLTTESGIFSSVGLEGPPGPPWVEDDPSDAIADESSLLLSTLIPCEACTSNSSISSSSLIIMNPVTDNHDKTQTIKIIWFTTEGKLESIYMQSNFYNHLISF